MAVLTLPLYPSSKTRSSLSPSQLATLNSRISGALSDALTLPPEKRDAKSTVAFISSYVKDHAQSALESLIWDLEHTDKSPMASMKQIEKTIYQRVLMLAEKLATDLDLQTAIDLCVVYARGNTKRVRALLTTISNNSLTFVGQLETEAVPAFTTLLTSATEGLYGLRKISHVLCCVLKPAPPEVARPFARSKHLMFALATTYDASLESLARSYGGFAAARLEAETQLDDWERIFLETKVALVDSAHVLLRTLLADVEAVDSAGAQLAARCEVAFEVVKALLELSPSRPDSEAPVPFLNRTLLEDYQHAYDLSKLLKGATQRADDPRTELLESKLAALDTPNGDPGALKLLVRSSGAMPGIDARGAGSLKGKSRTTAADEPKSDLALDAAVMQVLDILPEQDPAYVRYVLSHSDYPYKGDAERLIEALLEEAAPVVDEAQYNAGGYGGAAGQVVQPVQPQQVDNFEFTRERRNVFDDEKLDLSKLRIGKKQEDAATVLQDRAYIEQMKADILRRAEAMSDSEEEDDTVPSGKSKGVNVAVPDELDELDELGGVKVRDGEPSEDEGSETDGENDGVATPATPETILELAYIRDPKLFERDAQTRRSKGRQELKAQTGWGDEQIEGWRIMLERNPNKAKILQRHEFAGNQRGPIAPSPASGPSQNRGRGGPRGRGGGRGRGRGGGSGHDGSGGGGGDTTRDRAWKDKNKASRGNHNRKRGHDKKMARAGGPS